MATPYTILTYDSSTGKTVAVKSETIEPLFKTITFTAGGTDTGVKISEVSGAFDFNGKNITNVGNQLGKKSGLSADTAFTGNPKKATVTFTANFADTSYTVNMSGTDARVWSYESKSISGFTINSNSNQALTGEVSWQAIKTGEGY